MNRRQVLVSATTVGVAATAGCLGFFEDDPTEPAESFVQALDSGEFENASQYLHSQNPVGDVGAVADVIAGIYGVDDIIDALDITVEESSVAEKSDGQAVVDLRLSVDLLIEQPENTLSLEMRTDDGDWRVWSVR